MEPLLSRHNQADTPVIRSRTPRWRHPVVLVGGLFLLLLVVFGGILYYRFATMPKMDFNFVAPVKTALVSSQPLAITYETVGTLEADRQVDIKPEVAGLVRKIYFTEGQWVSQGDPLFQLSFDKQSADILASESATQQAEATLSSLQADYEARQEAVKQAQAEKELAETEYNRYKNLLQREFVSVQEVDQRRTQLKVAEANLALAIKQQAGALARLHEAKANVLNAQARYRRTRAEYADTLVRAPFSGQVGLRVVETGDHVMPSQKMVTLVAANPMKITFAVPERYLASLREGLPVEVRTESHPNKLFQGDLTFVDPVVSLQTRAVTIKARVNNPDNALQPGQYASVRVLLGQKDAAVMVPEESLVPQGERFFVYVVSGGKAAMRYVTVGTRIPGWVEILSGLETGERVVVGGTQKVHDGATVREVENIPIEEDAN